MSNEHIDKMARATYALEYILDGVDWSADGKALAMAQIAIEQVRDSLMAIAGSSGADLPPNPMKSYH